MKPIHYHNYFRHKRNPWEQSDSRSKVVGGHLKIKVEQEDILVNMVQTKLLLFVCERLLALETSGKCGNTWI